MKVLVCDDVPSRRDEIAQKIVDAGYPKPEVVDEKALTAELGKLFERARACMSDPENYKPVTPTVFDGIDVVILDNNLTHLEIGGPPLTAESIAGYIRAFTAATYIVSLNLNPDVDFDLRYLVGDFSTRADLALNTEHLANPGLWSGDPAKASRGFLPWYWPQLETAGPRRQQQIEFVRERLDQCITEVFGFSGEAIDLLSRHARGALSPVAASDGTVEAGTIPVDKLTFRDVFIAKDRSLPIKEDRERLNASGKANGNIQEVIARVVAADIDLWFRRDVLGPQEPLLDVPHLLTRFPFLLGERAKDLNEWNSATLASASPYGVEPHLHDQHLAAAVFPHEIWVKSPCFWWSVLRADEKLSEYFVGVKEGAWADVVFCEDRSQFVTAATEGKSAPVEFAAEFEGSWARRYVARIEGIRYAPRSRLAL